MSNSKEQVRIQLTLEQKAVIKQATGKDAEVLELSVMELEERIAPSICLPYSKVSLEYRA